MKGHILVGLALCGLALSGCGQSRAAQVLNAVALTKLAEVRVVPPTPTKALDSRAIAVSMPSKALKFPMFPIEQDGGVTVWSAQDGAQLAIRGDMVIQSRGFGMDLMSAQVPTVAEILGGGAEHGRVYNTLDGADSPVQERFTCTVSPGETAGGPATAHHVQEDCIGPRKIRNEFWIDSRGHVVQSRQWLSIGVGYVIFGTDGG